MNNKRRTNPRRRSPLAITEAYLRSVIDTAARVGGPTWDRMAMSADEKLAESRDVTGPADTLAEAMGYPPTRTSAEVGASVAEEVLTRSADALDELGDDIDPRAVSVGLDAASKVIKAYARAGSSGPSLSLMPHPSIDPIDGREHDHSLAPPKYSPPRGWDCCADLPGQRPTSWHADDLSDLVTGTADYPAEAYDLTPDELAVLAMLPKAEAEAEA